MGDKQLKIRLGEGVGQLVDARQHDEAVHEQQAKATSADPENQKADPCLPTQPSGKEEGARAALSPEAPPAVDAAAGIVADQGADAAHMLQVVVIIVVVAGHGAAGARVRAGAAAANVDEGDRCVQLRL